MEEIKAKVKTLIEEFMTELEKTNNKSAQKRARVKSVELCKALKDFRAISVKENSK